MRFAAEASRSQGPAPFADFRHIVAMLADIELVALQGCPVARGRLVQLIADFVKLSLIARPNVVIVVMEVFLIGPIDLCGCSVCWAIFDPLTIDLFP